MSPSLQKKKKKSFTNVSLKLALEAQVGAHLLLKYFYISAPDCRLPIK